VLERAIALLNKEENKGRRKLPQILVDQFKMDRDLVYREVADYYAFRTLDISMETIDDGVLGFIRKELTSLPESIREMVHENNVLPYCIDPERPGRLLVITPDPTKPEVYKIARTFHYQKFEICYVPLSQWDSLWKRVSLDKAVYKDKETMLRGESFVDEGEEDSDDYEQALEEEISKSGLVDLVESIFVDAVRVGASDIHVIPRGEKVTEFHFRVDGKLSRWYTNNETRAEAVSAVVKDRAKNLDRFERNMAQDGFAQLTIDKKTIRFRVSVIPLIGKELKNKFESIVIRVLMEPVVGGSIADLGFDPYSESVVRRAIAKPFGIIIITGPTGSGKSTTLVAALRTVMDPSLNIITVEDPVEYFIDGARQVKLNSKLDFEGALRAILRHDPDIVMVGEIRDKLTAEIAVKLANTGHLTLSTLHTNDAPSAVSRLYKMGIEPFLIAYSINIIVAQRLIRKLCERCKSPISEPDAPLLRKLGMPEEEIRSTKFYQPIGCSDCIKGYRGRTAIHEALYFTKEIRQLILDAGSSVNEEAIRQLALKNGMRTLRMNALELLKRGKTTVEEVASVTADDD
jgi:type IV pilus assembly protein PilB